MGNPDLVLRVALLGWRAATEGGHAEGTGEAEGTVMVRVVSEEKLAALEEADQILQRVPMEARVQMHWEMGAFGLVREAEVEAEVAVGIARTPTRAVVAEEEAEEEEMVVP